jgi:hypothetical protein
MPKQQHDVPEFQQRPTKTTTYTNKHKRNGSCQCVLHSKSKNNTLKPNGSHFWSPNGRPDVWNIQNGPSHDCREQTPKASIDTRLSSRIDARPVWKMVAGASGSQTRTAVVLEHRHRSKRNTAKNARASKGQWHRSTIYPLSQQRTTTRPSNRTCASTNGTKKRPAFSMETRASRGYKAQAREGPLASQASTPSQA